MAQRTKRASGNGKASVLESRPNPLTDTNLAAMIANTLREIAQARFQLRLMQVANGHGDDDVIPSQEPLTYAGRFATIDEQTENVRAGFPPVLVEQADDLLRQQ